MTFAEQNYAFLLFILPLLALMKIFADSRADKALRAFASSDRLRQSLMGGVSLVRSGLHFGLQMIGLGFFIVALTRPQAGVQQRDIQQSGRNILIAIDTSKSMLATDLSPNRLTRAKLAAQDLLEKLPGDRVGLIAFAGRSFLQAPLTTDHDAVTESVQALDHTSIPRGGSSLAAAIDLALETVSKMSGKQHGMIIFSDGQVTDTVTLEAAKRAADKKLLILTVGLGTEDGEVIPDPDPQNQGDYVRDENGNVVRSRLDSAMLRDIAKVTGGEYVELANQALTQDLVNRLMINLDRQKEDSRQETKPIERYQWPLFAGILFLMLSLFVRPSSRKPMKTAPLPVDPQATVHSSPSLPQVAALALLMSFTFTNTLPAAQDKALEQAKADYDAGRYKEARDAYAKLLNDKEQQAPREELAYGLGAASLQLKDYEKSASAFSQALQAEDAGLQLRAQRSLGTTLYNQGGETLAKKPDTTIKAWTDSLSHFESALKLNPGDKELRENRDFVKERLEELKKKQEEKKQQQQGKDKKKQKQKGQGKGEGEPEESEDGEGEPEQPQDQESQEDGEKKEHDAMQKEQGALPEGELKAGESGKPEDKPGKPEGEGQEDPRNDKTGFTQQEARSQLRNYADDQKSVQYLMRREKPQGGKDY
jgi:Ca-activated chloride channel homolog